MREKIKEVTIMLYEARSIIARYYGDVNLFRVKHLIDDVTDELEDIGRKYLQGSPLHDKPSTDIPNETYSPDNRR